MLAATQAAVAGTLCLPGESGIKKQQHKTNAQGVGVAREG